jgi:hypothetical protein
MTEIFENPPPPSYDSVIKEISDSIMPIKLYDFYYENEHNHQPVSIITDQALNKILPYANTIESLIKFTDKLKPDEFSNLINKYRDFHKLQPFKKDTEIDNHKLASKEIRNYGLIMAQKIAKIEEPKIDIDDNIKVIDPRDESYYGFRQKFINLVSNITKLF